MELGEIQKAWIKSLRENPNKQGWGTLGIKDNNYCCLGEALCVLKSIKNESLKYGVHGELIDGKDEHYLTDSYKELGLYDEKGRLDDKITHDFRSYSSISEMNDCGLTWLEIADYIEQNPENVFTKSV